MLERFLLFFNVQNKMSWTALRFSRLVYVKSESVSHCEYGQTDLVKLVTIHYYSLYNLNFWFGESCEE